jgi:hypothetical protein
MKSSDPKPQIIIDSVAETKFPHQSFSQMNAVSANQTFPFFPEAEQHSLRLNVTVKLELIIPPNWSIVFRI